MDPATVQTLVTVGSFLVLGTVYVVNGRIGAKILGERLKGIDKALTDFKDEIKKLQDVIIAQALQAGRIGLVEERQVAEGKRVDGVSQRLGDLMNELIRFGHLRDRGATTL